MAFRTIDTDIWSNAWFYDLKPAQKVMYIFLFSNPMVSNIGVLEVSRKQFASTTGVSLPTANRFLAELEEDGQVVVDGRLILLTKFIAKQTHFGGKDTEANKNDNLVKNLRNLWAACPSEKFKRVLQETYPNLFTETKGYTNEQASPSQDPSNPLPTEKEAPSKTLGSPYQDPYKPLGSEKEGSGGDIGDIGDIGEVDHTPLPPQGGTDAAASESDCAQEQTLTQTQAQAESLPGCETEDERVGRYAADRKRIAERQDDFEAWWARYPRKVDKKKALALWARLAKSGGLPDLQVLLGALAWQTRTQQWQDQRYIPHPTTYLNGSRWQDEPPRQQCPFPGARPQAQPFYGGKPSDAERNAMNMQAAYSYLEKEAAKEGVPFPPTNFDTMNPQDVLVTEALPYGQENIR